MRSRGKSLVDYIMDAIDEVAPGQGYDVYWRGWERYEAAAAKERRDAQARILRRTIQSEAPRD